jgi:hypothetical protein
MSRICHDANFREYIAAIQDTEKVHNFLMQALPEHTLYTRI